MRSPGEDIAVISAAGMWEGPRDPVLAATSLLVTDGQRGHQPTSALHQLAKAAERGDKDEIERRYARLRTEVESYLPQYPEIQGTLQTLAELSDEELEQIDSDATRGSE
jgi:hypothetical protein